VRFGEYPNQGSIRNGYDAYPRSSYGGGTMPAYHCGYFVGASIKVDCPQYEPKVSPST